MGYVQFEKRPQKCVETGSVHFWCNFLDIKKVYKVDTQFLVGFLERRERDWLPAVAHPYTPDVAKILTDLTTIDLSKSNAKDLSEIYLLVGTESTGEFFSLFFNKKSRIYY